MGKDNKNRTVYAVGDVHGHYELLTEVLEWIREDREARGVDAQLVMLGDYVDRGPDSRKVVDTLINDVTDLNPVCLLGNHEDMMLQSIREPISEISGAWYLAGGSSTLESYGWSAMKHGTDLSFIPKEHVEFLEKLPLMYEDEDRIYVHAGLRPGVDLQDQTVQDLLWIRHEFLQSDASFGKLVVHGHTPVRKGPDIHPNRINLDTGAFRTGVLTCAAFDAGCPTPRFFQTGKSLAPAPSKEQVAAAMSPRL